ncbi:MULTISPECIES: nitrate reductase molybdenum cofactor assembly chaperone [Bartonella]|uniref:nitrate reductase molybdenum cofactor assembly chaperone n=1 Tax=Bartonella TaxID=773 RepID=UPI0018DB3C86|nr:MULTISPECIES: nitrate reductase molybdenum cofactor assembly chaperone [Bartonella]MBI0169893.1 nitrate reductase molybdenum cofactor assembly chaperone [Bartonella sp. W8167]MBI0176129.1 nitrate reductase molybdenum cofactor assembly chaperone [Bartonella apis]
MNSDLKIISLLLSYPEEELQQSGNLIRATLDQLSDLDASEIVGLKSLVSAISDRDIYEVQEDYVLLFDRTRSLSLHLFEHVYGENRDRGQAMVDLKDMYDQAGFEIDVHEMPDYLPMFLEFLSTRSDEEARHLLGETLHIISAIRQRLQKRGSVYAAAFVALESLSGKRADEALTAEIINRKEDDPNDLEALDRIWEEEAITFGGNQGENDCGPDRLKRRIRAQHRDASAQI